VYVRVTSPKFALVVWIAKPAGFQWFAPFPCVIVPPFAGGSPQPKTLPPKSALKVKAFAPFGATTMLAGPLVLYVWFVQVPIHRPARVLGPNPGGGFFAIPGAAKTPSAATARRARAKRIGQR
jgi:hypothetical protein